MHLYATGVAALAALTTLCHESVAAQAGRITLVVQQGGRDIGRETFSFRDARARGVAGTTLTSAASYPATNPVLKLATTLERTPEGALAKFEMAVDSAGASSTILAAGSGALLVIRTQAAGSERGRELPGGPDVVLLDDRLFALYAQVAGLATPTGRALTGIFPRTGRRVSFTAQRDNGNGPNQRITLSGGLAGTLVTDAQHQLVRLDLPATQIVVTRLSNEP